MDRDGKPADVVVPERESLMVGLAPSKKRGLAVELRGRTFESQSRDMFVMELSASAAHELSDRLASLGVGLVG